MLVVTLLGCGRVAFDARTDSAVDVDADIDAAIVARSCAGLAPMCGMNEDCCARRDVPGGTFARSYDVAADAMFADAGAVATVSPFSLDRFEVTVARFRSFVDAGQGVQASPPVPGAGAHPALATSGWRAAWDARLYADRAALLTDLNCEPGLRQTWSDSPGAKESHPINCVQWHVAFAFCAWDGGRLPTEAEWNFAAAGGDEQRAFPFSVPPSVTSSDCGTNTQSGCAGDTTVVGITTGDGRWDHADLAGNVWEWVLDADAGYSQPCTDCADLVESGVRIIRGGSFFDAATPTQRSANRIGTGEGATSTAIGFRCAYPAS